jgi:hypothetical protein
MLGLALPPAPRGTRIRRWGDAGRPAPDRPGKAAFATLRLPSQISMLLKSY